MICAICGGDSNCICLCGFCHKCIEEFGHDECYNILKVRKEKQLKQKNGSK
jgi:hypothetical protein